MNESDHPTPSDEESREALRCLPLLRGLPQIERLLGLPAVRAAETTAPRSAIVDAVRDVVSALRADVLAGRLDEESLATRLEDERLGEAFDAALAARLASGYPRVVNATGIVLHTGLGRAVLPPSAVAAFAETLDGYSVVEVDRDTGERSRREDAVAALLTELTGAEAATVVNNNAAATLLILASLARDREVVVSRGEIVEIGGSYRIPDVMRESGARLVEVGTTNRTYVSDYQRSITDETGLLLQVHTSNYRIRGFTTSPELEELVTLGRERGIPVASDLGSGCFTDLARFGFEPEPLVRARVASGADVVCFSGDKLLGGPQAGIAVGRAATIAKMRAHPLYRALRVDKATLLLLEATLHCYRDPESLARSVPAVGMLAESAESVRRRARGALDILRELVPSLVVELVESASQAGSGALPDQDVPSWGLAIRHPHVSAGDLARRLRTGSPAVFVRVQTGAVLCDFRTLLPGDAERLVEALCLAAG